MTHSVQSTRGAHLWAGLFFVLVVMAVFPTLATQQKPAQEQTAQTKEQAAVVSAVAIKLGAELVENALPDLKKWASKRAGAHPGKSDEAVEQLVKDVDAGFAAASPPQRDAVVYLALYLAYLSADEDHAGHARDLRDMDREIARLQDELRMWHRSERASQRLEALQRSRVTVANVETLYRKRVDAYLVLLNHRFEALEKFPPEEIKGLHAPA